MSDYSSDDFEGFYLDDSSDNDFIDKIQNGYDDRYDNEENTDANGDTKLYRWGIDITQFEKEIANYTSHISKKEEFRLYRSPKVRDLRKQMDRVYTRSTILFSLDIEAWEKDINRITEIGISIYDPRRQEVSLTPYIKTIHIRIAEHKHLRNGKYVPDHAEDFIGENSIVLLEKKAIALLQRLINHFFCPFYSSRCILVGHDLRGDLQWLNKLGIEIRHDALQLDTQAVFAYTHGQNGASLSNALRAIKQPYALLHNAGNDAYYTLLLAFRLCDPNVRLLTKFDEKAVGRPLLPTVHAIFHHLTWSG